MMNKIKICIIGGGNLGHVMSGFIASHKTDNAANQGFDVTLLTRHPEQWSRQLVIEMPDGKEIKPTLDHITSNPQEAVEDADLVLLCLPGFAIRDALLSIRDHLRHGNNNSTVVGSVVCSSGFFLQAFDILPTDTPLFGFQRVPFIARIQEYGHRAWLKGGREHLYVAIEQTERKEELRQLLEMLTKTPTSLLDNYYEVTLTNSNPLLHPSRLYSLWKDWKPGDVYSRVPFFYEEWTEEAAQFYISMDNELQTLLEHLAVRKGSIPTVLDYYESTDASSLASKLRSIKAFKGIMAPMKAVEGGFVPDFTDRYFSEDFPYGLSFACRIAKEHGIETPVMDKICQWGMDKIENTL